MNLLTVSSMRMYRECPRKYRLTYEEGWRPVRQSESLHVGSMIHAALEAWWGNPTSRLACALAVIEGQAKDGFDEIRAAEIMRGYDARWSDESEGLEVLGVESEFCSPMLSPKDLAVSTDWQLAGKIDLLIRSGRVEVWEHKTTSSEIASDADPYWQTLPMDPQLSTYVVGAESLGYEVTECVYDVIRKPGARPYKATPPDKRKFKKDGSLYANQRETDETPDEFRARLREEIATGLDSYYRRRRVPRLNSELQNFLSDAWDTAGQIRMSRFADAWPRNPGACFKYGAEFACHFVSHCLHGADLESSGEFVRSPVTHPELEGVTTDGNDPF